MQKVKNERGITLVALTITVIVLSMISIPVIINTSNVTQFNKYTLFKDDIDVLRESISSAFFDKNIQSIGPKYAGSLSFLNGSQNGLTIKSENDNENYYVINPNKLNQYLSTEMQELNYGEGNKNVGSVSEVYTGTDDVYIINEASRVIYYVKGISYNGKKYYRLYEELSKTESGITPGEIVADFNKTYTDIYGAKAKIPVGYKVSTKPEEQIVSKGLVISDANENEFVWIPIGNFVGENGQNYYVDFNRYKYGTQVNNGIDNNSNSTMYKNSSADTYYFYEAKNYDDELSTLENGGFYVGRYEAGSTVARTASTTNNVPVVKKGISVYNYITKEEADTLSKNFINNSNVKSKLCSGYAWDSIMKFIERTGNSNFLTTAQTGTGLTNTGTAQSINNIFDLSGNVAEWVTELSSNTSNTCTVRGGAYSVSGSLPIARIAKSSAKAVDIGFRITLFLQNS